MKKHEQDEKHAASTETSAPGGQESCGGQTRIVAVTTEDGSKTLYDEGLGAHYRSTHGAQTESAYVFLGGTMLARRQAPWRVLELGFGGACNFLLTAAAFVETCDEGVLAYHTVDWNPIAPALFGQVVPTGARQEHVRLVQEVLAGVQEQASDAPVTRSCAEGRVHLTLYPTAWQNAQVAGADVHAVFHDPFGPRVNPDGWTEACFRWSFGAIAQDGILATYSAASAVRAAMVGAGYQVASTPGPGRKREITLASPRASSLSSYKPLSRERYLRKRETSL